MKNTLSDPTTSATTHSSPIERTPATIAAIVTRSATARPTSQAIIVARWSTRSTSAPAGRERTRYGTVSSAARMPSSTGPTLSVSTAMSGSATIETWVPSADTD